MTWSPEDTSATSGAPQNWQRSEILSLWVIAPQPLQVKTCGARVAIGLRGRPANSAYECSRICCPVGASGVSAPQYGHLSTVVPGANSTFAPQLAHGYCVWVVTAAAGAAGRRRRCR